MSLHSFETCITTPDLRTRHVIVYIEGLDDDGVPDWYFGHPNGFPSQEALRLCSEADYARITEQCVLELDALIDATPDYEGMAASAESYANFYEYR